MPQSFSSYNDIIKDFIDNRLQPDEVDTFFQFLEQSRFREQYGERIDKDLLEHEFNAWSDGQQANRLYEQIARQAQLPSSQQTDEEQLPETPVNTMRFKRAIMWRWAAVFILTGSVAYYFYTPLPTPQAITIDTKIQAKDEVMPGGDKAILTLASGKQIELGDSTGTITDEGLSIQHKDGRISYKDSRVHTMNTMTTPVGGQYQLTLADGTKVWLNAASSIRFPTAFPGKTRDVFVTGEVYFEVAKNAKQPFNVFFSNQQVQVLGTMFNINAYTEEVASTTTLVEGLVRITRQGEELLLQPNQQAVAQKKLVVNKSPDVSQVLAWKNGTFNFNGQDFAASMRQLERWYEIQVVYDGNIPVEKFGGEIDRNMTLNQALKVLNGIVANFKLEGKVLHVLPMPMQ